MPMNPMQRRARNSFLIGFLVSLIIMTVVVLFLLYRIKMIDEARQALEALQRTVLVANKDMESGQIITISEDLVTETVQTTMDVTQIVNTEDFEVLDDMGSPLYNEDGTSVVKEIMLKINVPKGTMITKDMIVETGDQTEKDIRIQEYNMILLPSQLKNGSYIDVRLQLPTGEDYIVISKKRVLTTTATSIWVKLSEEEILMMTNAIVESYIISGSKLYALEYVEPGIQDPAVPTYPVSVNTMNLIQTNPNIVQDARQAIWDRYNVQLNGLSTTQAQQRTLVINPQLESDDMNSRAAAVQSGNVQEQTAVKAAREEYVKLLEGTGEIGIGQ